MGSKDGLLGTIVSLNPLQLVRSWGSNRMVAMPLVPCVMLFELCIVCDVLGVYTDMHV